MCEVDYVHVLGWLGKVNARRLPGTTPLTVRPVQTAIWGR